MKEYALIVAGGKGTRMKSELPKQFMELCGRPVLMHTIDAFFHYSPEIRIVLVLPEDDISRWNTLVEKYGFTREIEIVPGGDTRFHSVKNGLQRIEPPGLVAIHDGVRPLVTPDLIRTSFKLADIHKAVVAAVPLKESIRKVETDRTTSVERSQYRLIQTPQTFDITMIRSAYKWEEDGNMLTDDASVAEKAGYTITLFEGSYSNIKITTPEDMIVAEALLKARSLGK